MNGLSKGKMIAVYILTAIIAICLIGAVIMLRKNAQKQEAEANTSVAVEQTDDGAAADTVATKTVAEMVTALTPDLSLAETTTLDAEKIAYYYELKTDDFAEASGVVGDVALADELVIMKAASSDQVATLEAGAQARLKSQKDSFESYIPEQFKRLDDAKIVTVGDYVMYVCSDQAEQIVEKFKGMVE